VADASLKKSHDNLGAARPDAIQPFGWLIVSDEMASKVRRCSSNLALVFPRHKGALIGAALNDLLGPATAHSVRNALTRCADEGRPTVLFSVGLPGGDDAFDVAVSRGGGRSLIEIERAPAQADLGALDRVRSMIERIAKPATLEKLLTTTARLLFSTLQYERVSVLRFGPDGAAELLARQQVPALPHEPPQGGLTEAARNRLAAAGIRLIADRDALPAPIVGEAQTTRAQAPDLSRDLDFALLRAVEPEERDALRRDGFAASLSLALAVDERLWGAILCQNREPRLPHMGARVVAEMFAGFLSLRVQTLVGKEPLSDGDGSPRE
jgi:light-regulated signal transduction histidine kinase (bacteriophytochrome)